MIKRNISEMRPILTAPTGPKRAASKQPALAAILEVPEGKQPSAAQRRAMAEQGRKWCNAHRDFLKECEFSQAALDRGGFCMDCQSKRNANSWTEKVVNAHSWTAGRAQVARTAAAVAKTTVPKNTQS